MERDDFEKLCREHPDWVPDDVIEGQFTERGLMSDDVLETYRPYLEDDM